MDRPVEIGEGDSGLVVEVGIAPAGAGVLGKAEGGIDDEVGAVWTLVWSLFKLASFSVRSSF